MTIEFHRAAVIALTAAQRFLDFAWALLAAAGVAAVALQGGHQQVSALGLLCATGAAASWGGYILASSALGRCTRDSSWLAPATACAALLVCPSVRSPREDGC